MFSRRWLGVSKKAVTEQEQFVHSSIDATIDSIRLVTIEPARDVDSRIVCTLQHVTFAQKPRYEALSYTWGDESIKKPITVDGKTFGVGRNLFDALRHVRYTDRSRVMWIDAICINQGNLSEKSQQIRLMPFTYSKALQVLIWLGLQPQISSSTLHSLFGSGPRGRLWNSTEGRLLEHALVTLCSNDYWRRVWVIQEIGLARQILIYIGRYAVDWERFIARVESCNRCFDCIPLKFKRQLETKYSTGHKLQTLIETHRNSLCKEPRDHIYGFIGLAIDCDERYPIDYSKSLFEVWKDAMEFKADDQESPQHDLLRFGKTVQTILGGPNIATQDELQSEIGRYMSAFGFLWGGHQELKRKSLNTDVLKLRIPARIAGCICHLGPTYRDIISDTRQITQWKASITRMIPERHLPSAREENDLFMEVLENVPERHMEAISNHYRTIPWKIPPGKMSLSLGTELPSYYKTESQAARRRGPSVPPRAEPRLFLLSGTNKIDLSAPAKMGLAPTKALEGDYVCQVQGIAKVLVVRKDLGAVTMIGSGIMAENKFLARARRDRTAPTSTFGTAQFDTIDQDDYIDLFLDMATAYELLN